jgi:hypothetical protein
VENTWIFCAGNRRSGSTVHYHYVRELVEQAGIGRGYGAVPGGAIGQKPWSILDYENEPGVKVWRSHRPTKVVKQVLRNNPDCRIVYIHRDMRDCLVSTMNHEPQKGFSWFMGSWVDNNIQNENYWLGTKHPTLMTKYEDMVEDTFAELQRIRNFLNLEDVVTEDQLVQIQNKYQLDRVKADPSFKEVLDQDAFGWAVGDGGFRPFLNNHVFNGTWGQFLTVLTEEEIYKIEARCQGNLINRGYPLYDEIKEK